MGIFSAFKKSAQVIETVNETTETPLAATMLDTTKIKAVIADLTSANEIFTQAGFVMEQLDIELGQVPKVTPHFKQISELAIEHEAALLAQLNDKKLMQFVLTSLFKSSHMKTLMRDTDMNYHGIQIEITSIPSVKTIFKIKP